MKLSAKRTLDFLVGSLLAAVLSVLARGIGIILRRNHEPKPRGDIAIIKMVGGGNLALALPMIAGIKNTYPNYRLILITSPSVAPFGKILGVFDEVVILHDRSVGTLIRSAVRLALRVGSIDTIIDLEMYSRLSACLTLLLCSRNRLGFFTDQFRTKKFIFTHLLFYNSTQPRTLFYNQLGREVGATPATAEQCASVLKGSLQVKDRDESLLCVGVGCSEFAKERQLTPQQWLGYFQRNFNSDFWNKIYFLGSAEDSELASKTVEAIRNLGDFEIEVLCGKLSLSESIRVLGSSGAFWGVDSGLLHYARILGIKTVSFWGPTAPTSRLLPSQEGMDVVHYAKVLCSPCVHHTETPPCRGRNICMQANFSDFSDDSQVLSNVTLRPDARS
jgi:ADP-heptose:LPS heptosyltransferase